MEEVAVAIGGRSRSDVWVGIHILSGGMVSLDWYKSAFT